MARNIPLNGYECGTFHPEIAIHTFFYKQPHFRVEPRVDIKILKVAWKLLSIFGIEAQGC